MMLRYFNANQCKNGIWPHDKQLWLLHKLQKAVTYDSIYCYWTEVHKAHKLLWGDENATENEAASYSNVTKFMYPCEFNTQSRQSLILFGLWNYVYPTGRQPNKRYLSEKYSNILISCQLIVNNFLKRLSRNLVWVILYLYNSFLGRNILYQVRFYP